MNLHGVAPVDWARSARGPPPHFVILGKFKALPKMEEGWGSSQGCETTQNRGWGVWTQHMAGVGDKSSRPTFRDPEVPIPKILNRLEEGKKPRVLQSSSRPGCGWITGGPFRLPPTAQ